LSWSELFRTQHRVHEIYEQSDTHRKRYDGIEHLSLPQFIAKSYVQKAQRKENHG
jgi:hypothetical protein